jgi:hypothetical protein
MDTTPKYPLAFDLAGDPITLPPEAVSWRVRRGGGRRGRPRPVFDQETGRQLEVALTATIEDLIDAGCRPDRYRLEAVDGEGRLIPDVVAIIELPGARNDDDDGGEAKLVRNAVSPGPDGSQQLIAQLVATICGVTTAMVTHGMRPVHAEQPHVIVEQAATSGADSGAPPWLEFLNPEKLTPLVAMIAGTVGQAFKSAGIPVGSAP